MRTQSDARWTITVDFGLLVGTFSPALTNWIPLLSFGGRAVRLAMKAFKVSVKSVNTESCRKVNLP